MRQEKYQEEALIGEQIPPATVRAAKNGAALQTPPCHGGHKPPSDSPGMQTGVLALNLLPAGGRRRGQGPGAK